MRPHGVVIAKFISETVQASANVSIESE